MKMPSALIFILQQSKQQMTCHFTILGYQSFYYTSVYASNLSAERIDLWCNLIDVRHSLSLDASMWIVCGGFNQIINPLELGSTNKQPADPRAKKLDRLLVNNPCLSSYPDSVASFLTPDFSDHAPCLLNLASPLPFPFKFLNILAKHPSFLPLIETAWSLAGNTFPHGSLSQSRAWLSASVKQASFPMASNNLKLIQ
ncbi:unnamed protein product [Thlaspi arvense]|uniref:Endonuclease/exonuclease/phosphatase domain-containing protein n=1 Tax=Thlaspi arvense TaxID=13288 RepID=A0AAU9T2D2_THLAR|nr:unnamed protein product [Thlaspi arvense]